MAAAGILKIAKMALSQQRFHHHQKIWQGGAKWVS